MVIFKNEETYIKLRGGIMIKINKKSQKILLIFLPILLVIAVFSIIISNQNRRRGEIADVPNPTEYTYRKVYLNSSEDTLVPLTIQYQKKDNLADELLFVFNLIKVNSGISNATFTGLVPENVKVEEMVLENQNLTINLDDQFSQYDAKNELRLIQQITWTMTEFADVSSISLKMAGKKLNTMPVKHTPIADEITRDIGINSFYLTSSPFLDSERVLSYYSQKINNKEYIVPFTQYVKNKKKISTEDLTIQTLLTKPSLTSRLSVVSCLQNVELLKASEVKEETLFVSFNDKVLFDETTVQKEVYDVIRASLELCDKVYNVSFVFDEEVYQVSGVKEGETYPVSSIYFNEYAI